MRTLLLSCLLLSQLFSYAQEPGSTEELLKQGAEYYDAEKYILAEKTYEKALSTAPENYKATMGLADSRHKQERYQEAIAGYDQAEKLNESDADLYFKRGAAKIFIGEFKSAINDFNTSEELRPDHAELFYYRGFANSELERYNAAINDYNRCIELEPDNGAAYYNRGAAIAELGDFEAGLKDFEIALEKDPELNNGRINIALSKLGMENYEEAIKDLTEVINKRDDNLARAYFYRGEAKYELGQKEDACSDWRRASNLDHQNATKNVNDFCSGKRAPKRKEIEIVF
jgi:serine/threonine-protein kinase